MLKSVQKIAEFVQEFEPVFLYLMEKNKTLAQKQEISETERAVKNDQSDGRDPGKENRYYSIISKRKVQP